MNQYKPFKQYKIHNTGYQQSSEPIIESAKGSFLIAKDGTKYFDPSLGAGSQIMGHSNIAIIKKVQEKIKDGTIYLRNNVSLHAFCNKLHEVLPEGQCHYVFCNSGSEATQRALRLARATTKRDKIGYFKGGWHGINEWTMAEDGGRYGKIKNSNQDGIPTFIGEYSLLLPYNDEKAFELIQKHSEELACIIIEPVQGSNPRDDIVPFLKRIEDICKKNGILLVLDEIITGFRLDLGGATKLWNLAPDIITYGKIIGGGLPIGLVTFTNAVSTKSFDDSSKKIYTGGTFSANPLVSVTALAVLNELTKADYSLINNFGKKIRQRLNSFFQELNLPFSVIGIGSISRLAFTNQKFLNRSQRDELEMSFEIQQKFQISMLEQKVLWPTNGILFNGFCNNNSEIEEFCQKVIFAAKKALI